MAIIRNVFAAGASALAFFVMRKVVSAIEKQSEAVRVKREEARDPAEFKRLKQDPATGVYYAED